MYQRAVCCFFGCLLCVFYFIGNTALAAGDWLPAETNTNYLINTIVINSNPQLQVQLRIPTPIFRLIGTTPSGCKYLNGCLLAPDGLLAIQKDSGENINGIKNKSDTFFPCFLLSENKMPVSGGSFQPNLPVSQYPVRIDVSVPLPCYQQASAPQPGHPQPPVTNALQQLLVMQGNQQPLGMSQHHALSFPPQSTPTVVYRMPAPPVKTMASHGIVPSEQLQGGGIGNSQSSGMFQQPVMRLPLHSVPTVAYGVQAPPSKAKASMTIGQSTQRGYLKEENGKDGPALVANLQRQLEQSKEALEAASLLDRRINEKKVNDLEQEINGLKKEMALMKEERRNSNKKNEKKPEALNVDVKLALLEQNSKHAEASIKKELKILRGAVEATRDYEIPSVKYLQKKLWSPCSETNYSRIRSGNEKKHRHKNRPVTLSTRVNNTSGVVSAGVNITAAQEEKNPETVTAQESPMVQAPSTEKVHSPTAQPLRTTDDCVLVGDDSLQAATLREDEPSTRILKETPHLVSVQSVNAPVGNNESEKQAENDLVLSGIKGSATDDIPCFQHCSVPADNELLSQAAPRMNMKGEKALEKGHSTLPEQQDVVCDSGVFFSSDSTQNEEPPCVVYPTDEKVVAAITAAVDGSEDIGTEDNGGAADPMLQKGGESLPLPDVVGELPNSDVDDSIDPAQKKEASRVADAEGKVSSAEVTATQKGADCLDLASEAGERKTERSKVDGEGCLNEDTVDLTFDVRVKKGSACEETMSDQTHPPKSLLPDTEHVAPQQPEKGNDVLGDEATQGNLEGRDDQRIEKRLTEAAPAPESNTVSTKHSLRKKKNRNTDVGRTGSKGSFKEQRVLGRVESVPIFSTGTRKRNKGAHAQEVRKKIEIVNPAEGTVMKRWLACKASTEEKWRKVKRSAAYKRPIKTCKKMLYRHKKKAMAFTVFTVAMMVSFYYDVDIDTAFQFVYAALGGVFYKQITAKGSGELVWNATDNLTERMRFLRAQPDIPHFMPADPSSFQIIPHTLQSTFIMEWGRMDLRNATTATLTKLDEMLHSMTNCDDAQYALESCGYHVNHHLVEWCYKYLSCNTGGEGGGVFYQQMQSLNKHEKSRCNNKKKCITAKRSFFHNQKTGRFSFDFKLCCMKRKQCTAPANSDDITSERVQVPEQFKYDHLFQIFVRNDTGGSWQNVHHDIPSGSGPLYLYGFPETGLYRLLTKAGKLISVHCFMGGQHSDAFP